ncbi:MAG: ABC transporter ATP-binding protein [Halanaerobiales bacterium]
MEKDSILSIRNLRKSYGSTQVLKGIDLDVNAGEIIGYIGPNGAGKSTTVKIMLGILEDYEGQVRIFGEDISESGVEYKKRIGYVPEVGEIYESLSAYEYLTFLGQVYGMELDEADEKAQRLMKSFDIEDNYHSQISSYSKGMKQKVLIIASILHNPDILFLDEPLSGLDANSVMVFKEMLNQFAAGGKTIFYCSHIMEVVEKISDRILLIDNGKIVADGSFEELKAMSRQGSLEDIFNKITGFDKHKEIASNIISIIEDVN